MSRREGRHFGGALLFLLGLSALLTLYWQGLSGGFHLDDRPNLQRLAGDDTGLLAFLSNPAAGGGSGRPLAYLSFYLQRESYPERPADFIAVNLGIHLFNVVLVYWLVAGLARARDTACGRYLALGVALFWGLLPVHVSAVLYVVQRMTLLAATLVLLGCVGYVQFRLRRPAMSYGTLLRLSLWVIVAYLGILAKENAILAGLGLALLEYFFLYRLPPQPPRWWRWGLFLGPPLLVAWYLLAVKGVQHHYGGRDFTLGERLLTETRVLWDYLRITLLPGLRDLGLHHDDFPVSRQWGWRELAAVAGWGLVLAIVWRRRWALWPLSFGLAWFLCMHLLEGTVVPLEIYFEHRNYLPSVGLAVGLGFLVATLVERLAGHPRRLLGVLGILYLAWLAGMTFLEVRAWSDPRRFAAESFYKHPDSLRAMEVLAGYFAGQGEFLTAYYLHAQWLERHPERYTPGLDLRMLMLTCYDARIPFAWNRQFGERLRHGKYDHSVDVLQDILERLNQGQCPHLSRPEYVALIDSLLANPRYHNDPRMRAFLKKFKATAQLAMGQPRKAFETVSQGMDLRHVAFDYLLLVATLAYEVDDSTALADIMALIRQRRPPQALLGKGQRDLLQRLERATGGS